MGKVIDICPRGHDKRVVGVATNRQCRQCRREQQTTPAYRARRRQRQRSEAFRAYRRSIEWRRYLSYLGTGVRRAISRLDERLAELIHL